MRLGKSTHVEEKGAQRGIQIEQERSMEGTRMLYGIRMSENAQSRRMTLLVVVRIPMKP